MGEETFCRFFKKHLTNLFFTFLNKYKIKLTWKLLIESYLQVSEIVNQCGYESLSFFQTISKAYCVFSFGLSSKNSKGTSL
jgi:AraC-like DNA-binding protein